MSERHDERSVLEERYRRWLRLLAVAVLVLSCVLVPPPMTGWENAVRWACSLLPALVPALALSTGFHRDAPPPRLPARRARLLLVLPLAAGCGRGKRSHDGKAAPGGRGRHRSCGGAGSYAQGWETTQLTSLLHWLALSKAFDPPLLAM
ncbi:hypothetical protein OHB01_27980 [Microbispora hainanensis]|jgi:hypothetical protein|uniref:Uncharacterized protein n=1 Tax=Microbispora hainanensis TaxID=568844 RepID=A0ABZ1SVV7_9ACTN|nr:MULTISPECIES: hypothetical protein [Microbispora]NJP26283.1 hypothetical protein [Microbispora sp. CL1-1]TQS12386.1 hypothetical protein FLW53_19165 [Microbispora sp. SCL1-1]